MKLRAYKKEDAAIICKWLRTEDELYRWSADRYNKFPLSENDIEESYSPQIESKRFFPLTAIDEKGTVVGHFIIRYPREDDDNTVRFGFVIVDPDIRGKGYGKEMLQLGIRYVRDNMGVNRIDLGVFEENAAARHCYEAVGFREYGRRKCEMPIGTWECIDMEMRMEIRIADRKDIDLMMDIRLEMLKEVNSLDADHQYAESFVEESRRYFLDGAHTTVLAFDGAKAIGCATICYFTIMPTVSHPTGKRAHLMNVYTAREYRGQGIGMKMVSMLIDDAWNRGATEISLDATEAGRPLYKKCGFEDSGECMVLVREK